MLWNSQSAFIYDHQEIFELELMGIIYTFLQKCNNKIIIISVYPVVVCGSQTVEHTTVKI